MGGKGGLKCPDYFKNWTLESRFYVVILEQLSGEKNKKREGGRDKNFENPMILSGDIVEQMYNTEFFYGLNRAEWLSHLPHFGRTLRVLASTEPSTYYLLSPGCAKLVFMYPWKVVPSKLERMANSIKEKPTVTKSGIYTKYSRLFQNMGESYILEA